MRVPSFFIDAGQFPLAVASFASIPWNLPVPGSVSFVTCLFILLRLLRVCVCSCVFVLGGVHVAYVSGISPTGS